VGEGGGEDETWNLRNLGKVQQSLFIKGKPWAAHTEDYLPAIPAQMLQ